MAAATDERRTQGEDHPLLGIPLAIKDVLCLEGVRTTCGSRILEDFIPPSAPPRSPAWKQPARSSWARPTPTATSPWVPPPRTPPFAQPTTRAGSDARTGGSSGGSAAAVAADLCLGTLGHRYPRGQRVHTPLPSAASSASRPSYGRVSRYGLIAFLFARPGGRLWQRRDRRRHPPANHRRARSARFHQHAPADAGLSRVLTGDVRGMRIGVPGRVFHHRHAA